MLKYIFFLFIILNYQVYALELNDKLTVKILKTYDENFLVLNRGLEDGIEVKDHAKITGDDGFIARGICVKTGLMTSHWKIYRVVHPELVSKDNTYIMRSLKTSPIHPDMEMVKEDDYSQKFTDWDEKDLSKSVAYQQDRIMKFDLPENNSKDKIIEEANKSDTEKFMDRNFDSEQFVEDFSQYQATIFASPISKQTLNDQEDINYGFQVQNQGQKYELSFSYNEMQSKTVNPIDESVVSSKSVTSNLTFDINRIFPKLSYFMFLNYEQSRQGDVYNPRRLIQGGILGLKFHLYEGEKLQKLDLSYISLLDQREDDVQEYDYITGDTTTTQTKSTNVRHSFRLRIVYVFNEDFSFTDTFWYRPYMLLDTREIDYNDTNIDNTAAMSYRLTENVSTSLSHRYTYDINQYRLYNIPPHNHITTLELNYSFTF
jgi:hypothetical protein